MPVSCGVVMKQLSENYFSVFGKATKGCRGKAMILI
jgi:hypothetical protein